MNPQATLAIPLLIPLASAAICLMLRNQRRWQAVANVAGSSLFLLATLSLGGGVLREQYLVTQFGGWPAPFGITFVADRLSAVMLVIAGVMAVAVSLYQLGQLGLGGRSGRLFAPLFHGLLLGLAGAFLTGDLFNLYVWFEVLLIASFGLLVVQGTRVQVDAGVKYAVLNLFATSMLLMSVGFLYGLTGTLNMADLSRAIAESEYQGLATALSLLFLATFAAKAAAFPLFFWLPASYPVASIPVAALFAALLSKVGVYGLLRCTTLIFVGPDPASGAGLSPATDLAAVTDLAAATGLDASSGLGWGVIIAVAVIAPLTMVTGVLGAASQYDSRRILAFHSISQIGYILTSVMIATPLAYAGAVYFMVHHSLVKSSLFLLAGIMRQAGNSYDVRQAGGLFRAEPLIATLFFLQAMSLAGIPPLSGFWAKFLLLRATLEAGYFWLVLIGLGVSLLTLYSMLKIWNEAFWKSANDPASEIPGIRSRWRTAAAAQRGVMLVAVGILVVVAITIGLAAEPLIAYAIATGDQLADPQRYIQAVHSSGVGGGRTDG